MVPKAQAIYNILNVNEIPVTVEEQKNASLLFLEFPVKNGGNYHVIFVCTDEGFVSVRTYGVASLEPEQIPKILPVLNELNTETMCLKFFCDPDNDLILEYDFPLGDPAPGATAMEVIGLIVTTLDEVYPRIMRAIWA